MGCAWPQSLALASPGPLGPPSCFEDVEPPRCLLQPQPTYLVMGRKAIARLFYTQCFPAAQRGPRGAGAASAGVDTQLPHATGPTCQAAAPRRGLRSYRRDLPQSCFISRPPEPHEAVGHSWEGDIFFPPLFAFVCRDPFAKIILEMLLKKKEGEKKKGQESKREWRGEHSASLLSSAASRRVKWRQIMP